MPAPFEFPTTTPAANLPLLFAGQSQKEFFVNQALAMIDALLQGGVTASISTPPADPPDGAAYRVIAPATGDWVGEEDALALRIGGAWQFVAAHPGMRIFDREAGQLLVFRSGWESASAPSEPSGGTIVDLEARAAIVQLTEALTRLGLIG